MPVELKIEENGHLIHYTFTDPWEITDLLAAYRKEEEYRNSVNYTVHSLTELSKMRRIPRNWLEARQGPGMKHPRSGEMVIVGVAPGIKIILDTIFKIARYKRVKMMNTAEEGIQYLRTVISHEQAPASV